MSKMHEPVALYARVPRTTKAAVDQYAVAGGLTLAAAVQNLLELGIETANRQVVVEALHAEVDALRDQLGAVERDRDLEAVRREQITSEYQGLQDAAGVWSERAMMNVGACPDCRGPVTGSDLLVAGRCSRCGRSTADLLAPPPASGLDDRELMMVLGAAGLLLGIIAITAKGGRG